MNNENWIFFKLKDIFKIEKSKNINSEDALNYLGNDAPYITRTEFNNGCKFIVNKENFTLEKGNCITIGGEGANVFYQPFDFISGNNITKIYHPMMNENIGLFLVTIINLEKYRYSYNRAFNKNNIENTSIKLPVDLKGDPDWKFMEEYISNIRERERERAIRIIHQ